MFDIGRWKGSFGSFKRITLKNVTNVPRFKCNERYVTKIGEEERTTNERANLQVIRSSRANDFLSTLYRFCRGIGVRLRVMPQHDDIIER